MVNACLSYELTGLIAGVGVTVGLPLTNSRVNSLQDDQVRC